MCLKQFKQQQHKNLMSQATQLLLIKRKSSIRKSYLLAAEGAQQAAAKAVYQDGQSCENRGRSPDDTTPTMTWSLLRFWKADCASHSSYTACIHTHLSVIGYHPVLCKLVHASQHVSMQSDALLSQISKHSRMTGKVRQVKFHQGCLLSMPKAYTSAAVECLLPDKTSGGKWVTVPSQ